MFIKIKSVTWAPSFNQKEVTANTAYITGVYIALQASADIALGVIETDDKGNETFVNLTGGYTRVAMTNEQYKMWGLDDSYAMDCFLMALGVERLLSDSKEEKNFVDPVKKLNKAAVVGAAVLP